MKKLFIILSIIFFSVSIASADWYIFSSDTNRCIGITQYEPSKEDLDKRGEYSFFSRDDVSIEDAEFFNGKVRIRTKSQEEKNKEKQDKDKIDKKTSDFNSAKQKLIDLGLTADEVDSLK